MTEMSELQLSFLGSLEKPPLKSSFPSHQEWMLANQRLNAKEAVIILSRWAHGHLIFPNIYHCGTEMDLAVVTKARKLWEVEIKLSVADWRNDEKKKKWTKPERLKIARMYYAVTPDMVSEIPDFVPRETGLLVFHGHQIAEHRPAKSRHAPRVTDKELIELFESTHWRFWAERKHRHYQACVQHHDAILKVEYHQRLGRVQKAAGTPIESMTAVQLATFLATTDELRRDAVKILATKNIKKLSPRARRAIGLAAEALA